MPDWNQPARFAHLTPAYSHIAQCPRAVIDYRLPRTVLQCNRSHEGISQRFDDTQTLKLAAQL